MKKLITSLFLILSLALPATAQVGGPEASPFDDPYGNPLGGPTNGRHTEASLIPSVMQVKAGETFKVALKITHFDHWHSYYNNDGENISTPPAINWTLPEGFTKSDLIFPVPHIGDTEGRKQYVYDDTVYFITEITAPKTLTAGTKFTITASGNWQVCKGNNCTMESDEFSFNVTAADSSKAQPDYAVVDTFAKDNIPSFDIPDSWKISSESKGNEITLTIESPDGFPKDVYFFEFDRQVTAQEQVRHKIIGDVLTVTATRYEDAEVSDTLRGTLYSKTGFPNQQPKAFFITSKLGGVTAEQIAESKGGDDGHGSSATFTEEDYAEMKTFYKADEQIKTITLNQIDNNGNIIAGADIKKEEKSLFIILGFAFLGGMILNLMPCVFPVLGIKVLGFVQLAGNDPKKIKLHGLVFALGMLVSMWVLATTLLLIRDTAGKDINWGDQMGQPIFVGIMIIALTLFGLNLYGVFEIGTSLTGVGGNLQSKKGYQGSFFSGVLTTLIATPCSGPFLGPTMGYTLQQTIPIALIVFTVFAIGIASPYVILAFFPKLIDKLPRPGAWMVTFKKAMAFPMFATVAFLLMSYTKQTGVEGTSWMMWALVVFATAAFIYGTWGVPFMTPKKRWIAGYGLSLAFVGLGVWLTYTSLTYQGTKTKHAGWAEWKPGMVEYQRDKKQIVWVDYTADW